jgi:hypothetical protein
MICFMAPSKICLGAEVDPVKLDLSYLNLVPKKILRQSRMSIWFLSYFEARLEYCGIHPDLERRATVAARDCVTPEALAYVAKIYRTDKEDNANSIRKAGKNAVGCGVQKCIDLPPIDCEKESEKKWLRQVKKQIDDRVDQIATACRECRSLVPMVGLDPARCGP